MEACSLVYSEHEVHVLDGLAYGTLQQVIDARGNQQLLAVFLYMNQRLVSVYYLLQVEWLVAVVGEGGIFVEVLVSLDDILHRSRSLNDGCAENTTGKVATIGNEVDVGIQITLHLLQALTDLGDVLVLEGLVDAEVIVTP